MSRLVPLFIPILVSVLLVKFFPWPFPYYVVTDQLYGTIGINYQNLALDFFIFFLMTSIIIGLVEILLIILVTKSLFKDLKPDQEGTP